MKKIDSLLQKVEVFEKMAVYGDRSTFLKTISQEMGAVAFPPEGLAQSLSTLVGRLNALANAWEQAEGRSTPQAAGLRDYARAFQSESFPQYYTSKDDLMGKIGNLRRYRDNTTPLLRNVPASLAGQVNPIQEELGKFESFFNGFMRNTAGVSFPGEPSATPTDSAAPAPAAKPKPQVPMSTLARQLATRMSSVAKQQLEPMAKDDPKRAAVVKQIESMAAQLKKMHDQLKAKPNKSLDDRFALIGISSAFQEAYSAMEYDDLQKAPTFDFGRSSAFEQE